MQECVRDFFTQRYGLASVAKQKLAELIATVLAYALRLLPAFLSSLSLSPGLLLALSRAAAMLSLALLTRFREVQHPARLEHRRVPLLPQGFSLSLSSVSARALSRAHRVAHRGISLSNARDANLVLVHMMR
eukprot:2771352-Rhodomonas_salina.3